MLVARELKQMRRKHEIVTKTENEFVGGKERAHGHTHTYPQSLLCPYTHVSTHAEQYKWKCRVQALKIIEYKCCKLQQQQQAIAVKNILVEKCR